MTASIRRVDLAKATPAALESLDKACDPATFGVNQTDVLDTSYRKAGKLDKSHFSLNLDVEAAGLLEAARTGLFSGKDEKVSIHAELYKLNVYGTRSSLVILDVSELPLGKGAFFKAHKDTPRGATMFGSLVLVLPTQHEGGTLVLRHERQEWSFDAAHLVSPLPHAEPSAAYVAFFSDVEHEVLPVTSGYRVTVTYNLYFVDPRDDKQQLLSVDVIQPKSARKPEVKSTLCALLRDAAFLPNGGTLGFGLRHLYPLPTQFSGHDDDTLDVLAGRLKGADSALLRACIELSLAPALYTVFEDVEDGAQEARALVACPCVVKLDTHDYDEGQPLWEKLCAHFHGVLVNPASVPQGGHVESRRVHWVTPLSDVNRVKTQFAAYGNEPMMGYLYQRVCLLASVGPPGQRRMVGR